MELNKIAIDKRLKNREEKRASSTNGWLYVLIAYYGFEYVRFQDSLFPFLAPLKIPMFLTLALAYYLVKNFRMLPAGRFTNSILILWAFIILWVPFATNNFFAFQTAKSMSMIFVTVFATVLILDDKAKFEKFVKYFSLFFGLISAWVIGHGGRGPGGFLADENDAALAVLVALPFVFFMAAYNTNIKKKLFYQLLFIVMISAIVFTSSRGGFVGLVVVFFLLLCMTRRKARNFGYALIVSLFLGGVVISLLPDGYVEDMQSISDTEDSTRNLRLMHWTTAIEIFKDNSVFGVGPHNYPWVSIDYFHLSPYYVEGQRVRSGRQSHSLYFTLIPELGLLGICLFLILLFDFRRKTKELRGHKLSKRRLDEPQFGHSMAGTLLASMGGFLSAGAFISVLYYPIFWHLLALSTAVHCICLKKLPDEKKIAQGRINR